MRTLNQRRSITEQLLRCGDLLEPRGAAAAEAMDEAKTHLPAIEPVSKNLHTRLLLAFLGIINHVHAVPPD